jgi:flagellin-like hook-associated protein FlgL
MSNDINLSAAIRSSLVSLQQAQTLVNTTQNDLSTGLKVNNAIDNPVAFFQAQALSDRASDFSNKQSGIDQGISSLSTALEGVTGIQNVVGQLQGLIDSAQSASSAQIGGLMTQYNTLRTQINALALDTSYQGLNLINGTGATLTVSFSTLTSSNLTVNSIDVTAGSHGLAVPTAHSANVLTYGSNGSPVSYSDGSSFGFAVSWNSSIGGKSSPGGLGAISAQTFFFSGTATQFAKTGAITFKYGSVTLTVTIGSAFGSAAGVTANATFTTTQVFSDGEILHFKASSGQATASGLIGVGNGQSGNNYALTSVRFKTVTGEFVINPTLPNVSSKLLNDLQNNLLDLRSQAQTIGSNVALLNTRLDFTNSYVNLLSAGSGKLTLADLNEEGANLLSLQTRQQLGIQALSFAGQNERAVLSLFR